MLGDLLAILLLCFLLFLFWQSRRQAELAQRAIARKCDCMQLQVVSVALATHRFTRSERRVWLRSRYQFEFSSTGDDCYIGQLDMWGFQVVKFHFPIHRVPDNEHIYH